MTDQYSSIDIKVDLSTSDLAVTDAGNLDYYSGDETPPNAVIRMAGTPQGGYTRMVRTGEQTRILNPTYYSEILNYLSATANLVPDMQAELTRLSEYDGRLDLYEVSFNPSTVDTVSVNLTYTLLKPNSLPVTFTSTL